MGRTVLVTGGCGFIGSHFVRYLLGAGDAWRVVNLDKLTYAGDLANLADVARHERYRFVHGDIAEATIVEQVCNEEKPWAVINFAAESHVDRSILDPFPFLRTNVLGAQVLLDAARRHGVERFVQVSTDEVYGDAEGGPSSTEESSLLPSSPYAASKAAADLLCLAYVRTFRVPAVIVRSANNYGPYQFPEKLIPLMIRNAVAGEPLPVYGDGGQVRDWLHVADNCEAIALVLERGRVGEVYNVAASMHRPNLEVVRSICRVLAEETGRDLAELLARIRFVPDRPGHDRRYAMDASKFRTEFSWSPRVTFEEGLRMTVRWYLEHHEWVSRVASQEYKQYYDAVYARVWNRSAP